MTNEQHTNNEEMIHPHSIFTLSFRQFKNTSLWFPPFMSDRFPIGEDLFAEAKKAKQRASAILEAGCLMASKEKPELKAELEALSQATFELDFFDFEQPAIATGWFRLVASAEGASAEALDACEKALERAHTPLMSAQMEGRLCAFGWGQTDVVPSEFTGAALNATLRVSQAFDNACFPELRGADLIEMISEDENRIVACVPAPEGVADTKSEFKAYAQIAQACVDAKGAITPSKETENFFLELQKSLLGQSGGDLPQWKKITTEEGTFFAMPSQVRAISLTGLPSRMFEECVKAFLGALSKRAGTLAASKSAPKSPFTEGKLSVMELCEMQALFAKLPKNKVLTASDISATVQKKLE